MSDITGIKTNILQKKAHCSPNPITLSVTLQGIQNYEPVEIKGKMPTLVLCCRQATARF